MVLRVEGSETTAGAKLSKAPHPNTGPIRSMDSALQLDNSIVNGSSYVR